MINFYVEPQQNLSNSPALHNKYYNNSKQLNHFEQNLYILNVKVLSIFIH